MQTRIHRRSFLKATVGGAAALSATASARRSAWAQDPRTLVVAWDSDIDTLDPAQFKAIAGYVTIANCYDTPIAWKVRPIEGKPGFARSHPGEFDPAICESWATEADGATLVFKVRRGARFPSGRPVDAHAVKYCFDRGLQSPGYMRIVIPSLLQVSSPDQFEVRDDHTFAIKMKAPGPMAMDIVALSNNAILDPEEVRAHATKEDPWAAEWLKRNLAGIGPYRLTKNEPGVEVVLEATPGYWRPAPYFQRIVFKFVPNEADRVLLLKRKAVDLVAGRPGLTPKNVKALEGEPGLKVFSVPDTTCHFLAINTQKPPFDNVKVRQAVNYAIPIQAILPNVLQGYATPMTTPIPHLTPGHVGTLSPYKYDLDKARKLMREAGVLDKAPIPVELALRVGFVAHEQASVWVQRELEKIGFKVAIVKETDATFRQVAIKGGHTLSFEAWQSWVNDPWYHLLFNFHSKSKFTNASFYSNPALDKLIDDNVNEVNPQKRLAAAREAQKILVEDAVWGFLWYDSWTRVMKADLVGLEKRWDTFERYYAVRRA
ncbi:MAG TPA: ABC transporter substrate-binding protein [Candidatus Binatia bacterium]|jgi:peptide/nickel transport system substrate-binding protein|nr:ABC transporter substrate-binding protein [Candidatus Binatia bacterium]